MKSKYRYNIPFKTKLLNIPRRIFKLPFLESILAHKNASGSLLFKKLVPPEYLYPSNTWRKVDRNGITMKLDISNVVDHEIYFNVYDKSFERFINEIREAKIVWDVGANIGWTVTQLKKKLAGVEIYAFEPSSRNRARLQENITLNDAQVHVVPYGLGDSGAEFKLYSVLSSNPGMNRILNTEEDLPYETIRVLKGDAFWQELGSPKVDALKIDVEGFEMAVLRGISNLLESCRPKLFIEVDNKNLLANNTSAEELLQYLANKGYKLSNAQTNIALNQPFKNLPGHFDVIAL